jgi:hypothetical protein
MHIYMKLSIANKRQTTDTINQIFSGGSSEEATEAVPPQIKLNKKKIKNIILN